MAKRLLVELVAECVPLTRDCSCYEDNEACLFCLNLAAELIQSLWKTGHLIVRADSIGPS